MDASKSHKSQLNRKYSTSSPSSSDMKKPPKIILKYSKYIIFQDPDMIDQISPEKSPEIEDINISIIIDISNEIYILS
jgi:hypothetical protein